MRKKRERKKIGVCAVKVPFIFGGAEILCRELIKRLNNAGYETDLIEIPFGWWPPESILPNAAVWRMLDITTPSGKPFDMLITTKFPTYLVKHPNKIAWLFHQMRELYDYEIEGSGIFNESLRDNRIREKLVELDRKALKEHKEIFTISRNVGDRLKKYTDIDSKVLYPPPNLIGKYYNKGYGDYLLSVGRLDPWKRVDLLVEAMSMCKAPVKAIIVGKGTEQSKLKEQAKNLKLLERVEFYDTVSDDRLIDLYAGARAVYFCPKDEDYGFITIEAFLSKKPVITVLDSGGPTEFVQNEVTGFVVEPNAGSISSAIDRLWSEHRLAEQVGMKAKKAIEFISWNVVLDTLLEYIRLVK